MRTHGWGGDPPADDDEARRRILAAMARCIDEHGVGVGIAEVARTLGVTRPTVYRYYPSTEELLVATVANASKGFLDRVCDGFPADEGSVDEVVVEAAVRTLEQLPEERYLWLMLTTGRARLFARGVTSPMSLNFGRALLDRLPVDWEAEGLTEADRDELAEQLLRMIQSFMLEPGRPPRRGDDLRGYLQRWFGPAVAAFVDRARTRG